MAPELNRKGRGDLAELKVITDLLARGHRVALPYGEDWEADVIVSRSGSLERVQVKHCRSADGVLLVRCFSHSLTNGKVRSTKRYTADTIEWLAAWDATTDRCFYIPASELGTGRSHVSLRIEPARNGQRRKINDAERYTHI